MADIVRKRGGGPNELTGMRSGQNVADRDLADMLSQIQHNIEVLAGRLETLERMVAMQDEPEFVERPQEVIQQTTEESTDVTWNVLDKLVRQTTKYAKAATGQEIRYAAVYEKATKAALDAIPEAKIIPSSFGRVGEGDWYVWNAYSHQWVPLMRIRAYGNFPPIPTQPTIIWCKGALWGANAGATYWDPISDFTTATGEPRT